jgi:thioredoxin-like negative regulator of GroEL
MNNEIQSLAELQQLVPKEKGLLIYFYSNRCAPCVSLRPKVSQVISEDFSGMKMVLVDSEKNPELPAHYGVFANPTIIVFFEGREFRRYSKYISINELGSDISRIYEMVF